MAKKKAIKVCRNGHRMTPANTYRHPAKGPQCRECIRAYQREFMRRLRAKQRLEREAKAAAVEARRAARKRAAKR